MNNRPIGVIDSGVGGLTILKSLNTHFPQESYIYYGDIQNAPYGEKDTDFITSLTEKMVPKFFELEPNSKLT